MRNWKRTLFYAVKWILRWIFSTVVTLLAVSLSVYMLENPNGRITFYVLVALTVPLLIGNLYFGDSKKRRRAEECTTKN